MSKYKSKPKDAYGARQGTIAAKVNRAMEDRKWKTVDQVAQAAKINRAVVHRRLQHGRLIGVYDYERVIRFKLKKGKKKK